MSSLRLFLVGLPASGKSTMGKRLANDLELLFIDLDDEIERNVGRSIPDIFEQEGEGQFRIYEKDQLDRIIRTQNTFILSTGGGTPCFFDNMKKMNKAGVTVYIQTPIETISERLKQEEPDRPLMKTNRIEDLLQKRKKWYEQAIWQVSTYSELLARIIRD